MENLSSVSPLSAFLALKSHSLRLDSKSVENNREPGGVGAELFQVRPGGRRSGLSEKVGRDDMTWWR